MDKYTAAASFKRERTKNTYICDSCGGQYVGYIQKNNHKRQRHHGEDVHFTVATSNLASPINNLDLVSSAPQQQPVISDPLLDSQYSGQDETTSNTNATARMPSLSMDYDNSQDDHQAESTHDGLVDDDTLSKYKRNI